MTINVILIPGLPVLGELHFERGGTGNRGNSQHPGGETPLSGHRSSVWECRSPQNRPGNPIYIDIVLSMYWLSELIHPTNYANTRSCQILEFY